MRRKRIILVSSLCTMVLVIMLVLSACSPPSPTPQLPAATPAPTPTKTVKLKFTVYEPKTSINVIGMEWWAAEVTKRTGGAVKVDFFYSETLAKAADTIDTIKSGLADIGNVAPGYIPGKIAATYFSAIPGLTSDVQAMARGQREVCALPAAEAELKAWNAKYLFSNVYDGGDYIGKKPLRNLGDFKGLRVRAPGDWAKLFAPLGALLVSITSPETYDAMQKGVLDGAVMSIVTQSAFGLHELSKYFTTIGISSVAAIVSINLDVWNSLDSKTRDIMLQVSLEADEKIAQGTIEYRTKLRDEFSKRGIEISALSPADQAKLKEMAQPLFGAWADAVEKKGLPGKLYLDTLVKAVAKYEKK